MSKTKRRAETVAATTVPQLIVTRVATFDDPDGRPWPPSDDGFWAILNREDGRTAWRQITLG